MIEARDRIEALIKEVSPEQVPSGRRFSTTVGKRDPDRVMGLALLAIHDSVRDALHRSIEESRRRAEGGGEPVDDDEEEASRSSDPHHS
jgi:hypothetical protein